MKTAVDYIDSVLIELIEKFNSKEYQVACDTLIKIRNIVIEQAKEMEIKQAEKLKDFDTWKEWKNKTK